ncbi:MAG: sialidase family protein [Victivallales bacterium]
MSFVKVIETNCISQDNSAFPTIVKLENGDLICGFNVGGGPEITGGSDWARSTDKGGVWKREGCILPSTGNPATVNSMRLSRTADGRILAYGQRNYSDGENTKFGTLKNEAVFCVADPACRQWSKAVVVPHRSSCPLEVSNPIVVLTDGRWLAPAALLPDAEHLGEKVIVSESCDEGKSWNNEYVVFTDPNREKGFFEQKLIETEPGKLLAFAWTVKMGEYHDLSNHFAWSEDGGRSWEKAIPAPINGQTLSPFWLGRNKFLLIYNYRCSPQGIKLALAEITSSACNILDETFLWRPTNKTGKSQSSKDGIEAFDGFAFGLPSLTALDDKEFLAVFWNKVNGTYGVNSIKFRLL